MTTAVVLVALVLTAAAVVWVRGRLAAAEAARVELEAFRVSVGLPPDRARIIDIGPLGGWRTRRSVPSFRTVHASAAARPVPAELGEVAR